MLKRLYILVIVTVNTFVTVFPAGSSAVYVTGLIPRSNSSPGIFVGVKVTLPELSLAVGGVHDTASLVTPGPTNLSMFPGRLEITGFSLSVKVF